MICCLPKCGEDSGNAVLCPSHQKTFRKLSAYMKKIAFVTLHEIVRDAHDHGNGMITCFHCEEDKPRDEICGDHFPLNKGSHPEVKWRPDRCVPSCSFCNTNPSLRKPPKEWMHLLENPFTLIPA